MNKIFHIVVRWFEILDQWIVRILRTYATTVLRSSLGIVFVWFGLLKVIGMTPVADLVAKTVYWTPISASLIVVGIGWWEICIGIGLLTRRFLRITIFLLLLQQFGTLLVLLLLPHIAFQQGNPLLLSIEGEFVIKNIVLISAGLVVGSLVQVRTHKKKIKAPCV